MVFKTVNDFPKALKLLTGTFLIVLSLGFFTGISFVGETTNNSPKGIQENYLGNETDMDAEVMKFKKTEKEMLNIIHAHILSMALIFFVLGGLVFLTDTNPVLKKFLMMEPLLSVLFTFGGIYFMWQGILWMKYVVMVSGLLMTASFALSAILVFWGLVRKSK
ncbi:MAG TPA: hypothetical protein VFM65_03815 [Flavobacteriaceae bacterium]|nr:hypothetical protein [Flavobacteriaceae bacterium]